jgi:hypothetical protein
MIDNTTVVTNNLRIFNHLNVDFFEKNITRFEPIRNSINRYKLKNSFDGSNSAYLRVDVYLETSFLKITGSLRKWYYGQLSLSDFTKYDYIKAIRLLAECLGVSYDDMLTMEYSSVEIGMNVSSKTDFSTFKQDIKGFKNKTYKSVVYETAIYFKNGSLEVKMYDKIEEIKTKLKSKKRIMDIDEIDFLESNKNKISFRVEFKISKGKSRIYSKTKIKTIGDAIDNFNELYIFFWNSLKELQFGTDECTTLEFNPEIGSTKEYNDYLIDYALNSLGYDNAIALTRKLNKQNQRQVRMKIIRKYKAKENQSLINVKNEFFRTVRNEMIMALYKNKSFRTLKDVLFN